jgi:hypothetical protein
MRDKHQIIEEPCEGKPSCTVLKTSGVGDNLAEFNEYYTDSKNLLKMLGAYARLAQLGKRESVDRVFGLKSLRLGVLPVSWLTKVKTRDLQLDSGNIQKVK